jgi:hypothetical protein
MRSHKGAKTYSIDDTARSKFIEWRRQKLGGRLLTELETEQLIAYVNRHSPYPMLNGEYADGRPRDSDDRDVTDIILGRN